MFRDAVSQQPAVVNCALCLLSSSDRTMKLQPRTNGDGERCLLFFSFPRMTRRSTWSTSTGAWTASAQTTTVPINSSPPRRLTWPRWTLTLYPHVRHWSKSVTSETHTSPQPPSYQNRSRLWAARCLLKPLRVSPLAVCPSTELALSGTGHPMVAFSEAPSKQCHLSLTNQLLLWGWISVVTQTEAPPSEHQTKFLHCFFFRTPFARSSCNIVGLTWM